MAKNKVSVSRLHLWRNRGSTSTPTAATATTITSADPSHPERSIQQIVVSWGSGSSYGNEIMNIQPLVYAPSTEYMLSYQKSWTRQPSCISTGRSRPPQAFLPTRHEEAG
ncbi:hypothetical protein H109_04487 [Trichophyton interdigitale MR816]|uniref:Uncharacterized protein n=1 Tax=Trichophyton interdigitale (strain MR816) TaxID=1215338 RepID=A0A059J713_TRIIM|nr:hypothetical protein H109_04487 [Trichophyton interdigitale MR816]